MKGKKRTLYLLLIVVGIYAAVVARFFILKSPDKSAAVAIDDTGAFQPITYTVEKEFTIKNDHPDPFLGVLSKKKKIRGTTKKKDPVATIPFPQVKYIGLISDPRSNTKIFSLQIGGKEHIVRIGNEIGDIRVLSGNKDNITLLFKGERKIFERPK